jgi:diaminopimelate epimerase
MLLGGDHSIETHGGILMASARDGGAIVNIGEPRFAWEQIPLAYAMDTSALPLSWPMAVGILQSPACVNVGNPHAIFFVDDVDGVALEDIGPVIEQDPIFPSRVNVNIAQVTGTNSLKLRVWERGAGLTLACGTGACATAVAAIRARKVQSPVDVHLPGGILQIAWQANEAIIMRGDAKVAYRGTVNLDDFANTKTMI